MKVTPDNIFAGAKIRLGDEIYFVIKVNAKSFYASKKTYQEFLEGYSSMKDTTFTAYCKAKDIKQHKYSEPFEIEENEFSRKLIATENSKRSYKLERVEKNEIVKHIALLKKKKKPIVLSPTFTLGKKRIFFLKENGSSYLANIDSDYVLFDINTDEWLKISTVFDYNYEEVPWERLSINSAIKKMA